MTNIRKALSYSAAGALFGGAATLALQSPVVAQQEAPQNTETAIEQAIPPSGAPMSFADLAERLQPAVVNVSTTQEVEVRRMPFGQGSPFEELFRRFQGAPESDGEEEAEPETREASSLGSGFIISPDGYVVTNNHVVTGQNGSDSVDSITVTLIDEREYEARIIGRDPLTDLALLKIEGEGLPYVRFGNSESVRVGDWVVAIGNPFGLGGSVTAGIVSALHRVGITGNAYDRFIQTDASINRGNSGGPMFDLQGNVIGINTAIFSPTGGNVGIGFAVPASQAQPVIEQLRTIGRVRRGYLGVSIQNVDEALAQSFGLDEDAGEIVASVEPGGPADEAGIERGDIILSVNGQDVTDQNNLSTIVAGSGIGREVPITLLRDGRRMRVQATLAERPTQEEIARAARGDAEDDLSGSESSADAEAPTLGITLTDLTPRIRRQLRLDDEIEGVVVADVESGSDAARKGISRGSVIVSINRQPTRTPAEAAAIVEQARENGRDAVALFVKRPRDPQPNFVGVEMMRPEEE